MKYIFIINGRYDRRPTIDADLERQLEGLDLDFEVYHTTGIGDGTRYVRIYCDLHQDDEVCFVACGGCGTINETASGIVGFKNKSMAVLAYGATNDFIKSFPGRDFHSVRKMIEAPTIKIDILKANNNYSLNLINVGFDAYVAYEANLMIEDGHETLSAYKSAISKVLFTRRVNPIRVIADGKPLNKKNILLCTLANGRWCGGQYICSPRAVLDDGYMEVCVFKPITLLAFLRILKHYEDGSVLDNKFCLKRLTYCRAKHVELHSNNLLYICPDGETVADIKYEIDVIPKAITLKLPSE